MASSLSELEENELADMAMWYPAGSQYIPGAASLKSDRDYLVSVDEGDEEIFAQWLAKRGFVSDISGEYADTEFVSYKRGDINLIVMPTYDAYAKAVAAQQLCEALGLVSKGQRIILWDYVVHGRAPGWEDFE